MGRSFAARLIIPLTIAAALVIACGLLLDYQLSRSRIIAELETRASTATDAAAQRLSEMNTGVQSTVRLLGDALREVPDEGTMEILLRSMLDSNPYIAGATIAVAPELTPQGAGHAPYLYRTGTHRSESALTLVDLADGDMPYWEEPWFRRARDSGAPLWVEPYLEVMAGEMLVTTFAAPIYRSGGSGREGFIAVVTADVALADLHEYLEGLRIDSTGFGFVLTREGKLIGSPLGPVIMAPLEDTLEILATETNWPSLLAGLAAGTPVDAPVRCSRRDDECRVRIRPVSDQGWSVGVVYSEEELLRPLRNYETRVLTVGAIMLLMLAMLVSLITRRLMRPLQGLATAMASMSRGELDVELPANPGDDEVGQLVRAFDGMRRDLGNYIAEIETAAAQRSRMDGELSAAHDIQMAMLPQGGSAREQGKHFDFWTRVRPARAVGGDLYSYHRYGDRLLFSIGDVSDKGVPAALFMARAISAIQQWEVQSATAPPHIAMEQLNTALARDNENCMFLTLNLAVLDLRSRVLSFASGGHSPPLLLRNGQPHSVAQESGPALGLKDGIDFSLNTLQLRPGDRLVLFTDGFDDAVNSEGAMLGADALQEILVAQASLPLAEAGDAVFDTVDRFCNGAAQFDDMTLLMLDIPREQPAALQSRRADFVIDTEVCARAMAWFGREWQSLGLWDEGGRELLLVLEELVCNVRDHSRADASAELQLCLECFADHVRLICEDPAPAYNPLLEGSRAELGVQTIDAEVGGLGLHLITSLTDAQFYRRENGRNILEVRRKTVANATRTIT